MYTIVPKKSLLEFFADFEINWQVKPQIIKIVDSNQDFT